MATIRSSITLHDNISRVLNSIVNGLNRSTDAFEGLDAAANVPVDGLNDINDAIEDAISSQEELNRAVDRMDVSGAEDGYSRLNGTVDRVDGHIRDNIDAQEKFNDKIRQGEGAANSLKGALASIAGMMTFRTAKQWVDESIQLTHQQIKAEQLLANVLSNQGAVYEDFAALKQKAADIQSNTMYSDEAMIGGAAELSTYLKDAEAVQAMMGTLADYAAGMAGGAAVGYKEMIDYATQLGKALDGNYQGLKQKGFELSEAQQEIIENGTDMEKALVISDVVNQSWAGLAEQMARTPQGLESSMNTAIDSIREKLGAALLPAIMGIFTLVNDNMPQIERMIGSLVPVIQLVVEAIGGIIEAGLAVYQFFADNWPQIAPIILGIAAAFLFWKTVALLQAAAQWLVNAALAACPIVWIAVAIGALITIIYFAVDAWNEFADEAVSATGVVFGAFAALGASIFNILATMANHFITIAEFFANVWRNPIYSVKKMFGDLIINVLDMLISFTRGWDQAATNMYNAMADAINGVIGLLNKLIDALNSIPLLDLNIGHIEQLSHSLSITNDMESAKAEIEKWVGDMPDNYKELSRINLLDVNGAYDAGYDLGEGLEKNIKDRFSFDDIMGGEDPFEQYLDLSGLDGEGFGGGDDLGGIANDVGKIAGNTKGMNDATDLELKYLRDLAEKEAINRFTIAEIKFDMGGVHNNVNNEMDLDGIADYIGDAMMERLEIVAEGDYA